MTRPTLLTLTLALLLLPAAAADAADYCVADPTCVARGGTHVGNGSGAVQDALDLAEATAVADRVVIGPGTFDAVGDDGYEYFASSPVEIAGAGADKTVLTMSVPKSDVFTLEVDAPGSTSATIHDLGFLLGPGYGGNGLALAGATAERIAVTSGPATDANQGVRFLSDAVLRDSTIDVRGEHPTALLIGSLVAGDYLAERVTITSEDEGVSSGPQPGSEVLLAQLRVHAPEPLAVERATLRIGSSVLVGSQPVRVHAGIASSTLVADHVTLSSAAQTGVEVLGEAGRTAAAVLRNSIVTGAARPFVRQGAGGTARITTDHVAHGPLGTGFESGSGETVLQASLPAPDGFADAALRLRADSPLVDAGTPPTIDEPAVDLDGNPRVADGNGDCAAHADIGAYELVPAVPCGATPAPPSTEEPPAGDTTAPVVSALDVRRRGARLALRLSEAASLEARVHKRARGRWKTVTTIRRAAPAGAVTLELPRRGAGRRRVTVVAVDAAGNRSAPKRKRYRLAAGAR